MLGHASAAMTLDIYAGLFADDLDDSTGWGGRAFSVDTVTWVTWAGPCW
jgi:hypothetical protein